MISNKYIFRISYRALVINSSRSALTVLGIVIGIAAVILIMSLGQGAKDVILGELGGIGADTIIVRPGQEPKGPSDIAGTIFSDSLKKSDIVALENKSNAPYVISVMPFVVVTGSVAYGGDTMRPSIYGGSAQFFSDVFKMKLSEGELFTDSDIKQSASVAVIGSKVRNELFGASDALGQKIKVKGQSFRVVGILEKRGQTAIGDVDNLVIVPVSTAQTYLLGIDYYNEIIVRAKSPEDVERTVYDIEATLREQHNITDPSKDDFFVITQEGAVKQVESILSALTAFLMAVVAISLVVGGVGVMNVMLVSVTERTHEIGLRKAVGATNRDILLQFLIESVLLTLAGGIIGILVGFSLGFLVALGLSQALGFAWQFSFPISAVLLGIGMAVSVGLVFGIYPAKKAAEKSPIEALRYE